MDLCGFLFNLLDNAVEAAAKTEHSEIVCSCRSASSIWPSDVKTPTMGCCKQMKTDSYAPQSRMPGDHGFGLCRCEPSPRSTAAVLAVSYDDTRFTVMTALKLLPEKESPKALCKHKMRRLPSGDAAFLFIQMALLLTSVLIEIPDELVPKLLHIAPSDA